MAQLMKAIELVLLGFIKGWIMILQLLLVRGIVGLCGSGTFYSDLRNSYNGFDLSKC